MSEENVSLPVAQALASALEKIEAYVPTEYVDNSEPDIDAEHLNHAEQGIMRVTNLLNAAVDVIQGQESRLADAETKIGTAALTGGMTDLSSGVNSLYSNFDCTTGTLSDGDIGTVHGSWFKYGKIVIYQGYINPISIPQSKWYTMAKLPSNLTTKWNTSLRPLIGGTGAEAVVRDAQVTSNSITAWLATVDNGKYIWFDGVYLTNS